MEGEPDAKRAKKVDLPADEFVAAVDAIVQRDFFPDLPHLRLATADVSTQEEAAATTTTEKEEEEEEVNRALPLDEFMARYRNEDDAAFEHIVTKEKKRKERRTAWVTQAEQRNEQLRIEAAERGDAKLLITWPFDAHNTLFYAPRGAPQTAAEREEIALSGAMPSLSHEATRMTPAIAPTSETVSQALPMTAAREYVATPTLNPSDVPIMTWGTVMGTPLPLATPGRNEFRVPELPRRERVGMALAEKVAARAKARCRTPSSTPSSITTPSGSRMAMLSPAGRTLATRLGTAVSDSALRASYSPAVTKRE